MRSEHVYVVANTILLDIVTLFWENELGVDVFIGLYLIFRHF